MGYCPQFDALIDKLTVSETLSMYARLRGVQQSDVKAVVHNIITNLLLTEYEDKQAGQLRYVIDVTPQVCEPWLM